MITFFDIILTNLALELLHIFLLKLAIISNKVNFIFHNLLFSLTHIM